MSNCHLQVLLVAIAGLLTQVTEAQQTWTLDGVIYSAPDVQPMTGKVVIAGKKILSVATAEPRAAATTKGDRCNGGVIVAGVQNSHVHFISEQFRDAGQRSAAELDTALTQMLTRYGYTTVFDVTSDGDNTLVLRNRIEKGEVRGPRILTVGALCFRRRDCQLISHTCPRICSTDSRNRARWKKRCRPCAGT